MRSNPQDVKTGKRTSFYNEKCFVTLVPDESVWRGDGMEVRFSPVENIGVWKKRRYQTIKKWQ